MSSIAAEGLRSLIDKIEALEADKAGIADDIKDVYGEAKALGYNAKIIRKVVAIRKRKADDVREEQELLDIYLAAIEGPGPLFETAEAA